MKAIKNLITCTFAAAFLAGDATAQQMSFSDANLVSGTELEAGSSYRFSNVTSGVDAVVTIDALTNTTLLSVDTSSANAIENEAWRPTLAGTGGEGLHYADFTVIFYANGTSNPLAPDSFTTTALGNDLGGTSAGFIMEFAQVAGYTSMIAAEEGIDTITYDDGSSLALASAGSTLLASWNFENKPGYAIRFGWQGGNRDSSGSTFGALMDNTSLSNNSPTGSPAPPMTSVPEPSSVLLFILSIFPLALRRKRP
ncbi:MAG: PEP-CTERM sorting domain-containing protein [Akkermansiaceae bacterium]|nr:PEP-CTERM sorting domain-containing protein [Akkermansiaceae bacterium]